MEKWRSADSLENNLGREGADKFSVRSNWKNELAMTKKEKNLRKEGPVRKKSGSQF